MKVSPRTVPAFPPLESGARVSCQNSCDSCPAAPSSVTDDVATTAAALAAAREVAAGGVRTDFPPSTAGDDFAFFADAAPGCCVWLGNGPAIDGALHHNGGHDFADTAIPTDVRFWVRPVERELAAVTP